MTDNDSKGGDDSKPSEIFTGSLRDIDVPILREHIEDVTRWAIREAVGGQVPREQCDELAEEIAVMLSTGLAPAVTREVTRNIEKAVADLQDGPVSFDSQGRLTVDGYTVPDLVRLLDALGQLVENGTGGAMDGLHDSHRMALLGAWTKWREKQGFDDNDNDDNDDD